MARTGALARVRAHGHGARACSPVRNARPRQDGALLAHPPRAMPGLRRLDSDLRTISMSGKNSAEVFASIPRTADAFGEKRREPPSSWHTRARLGGRAGGGVRLKAWASAVTRSRATFGMGLLPRPVALGPGPPTVGLSERLL